MLNICKCIERWGCCAAAWMHSLGRRVGYRCWQVWLHVTKSKILNEDPLAGKASQKRGFSEFTSIKNALNYFWSNSFSEVKNSINLPTTILIRRQYFVPKTMPLNGVPTCI
jgi:hypothetical protein